MTSPPPPGLLVALQLMGSLLRKHHQQDWADACDRQAARLVGGVAAEDVSRTVLGWFGGAGSLNDLVLQTASGADIEANQRLADLGMHLHALSRETISGGSDPQVR